MGYHQPDGRDAIDSTRQGSVRFVSPVLLFLCAIMRDADSKILAARLV